MYVLKKNMVFSHMNECCCFIFTDGISGCSELGAFIIASAASTPWPAPSNNSKERNKKASSNNSNHRNTTNDSNNNNK